MTKFLVAILFSFNVFAHGDHSAPGALPALLHGGERAEAKHIHSKHKHDHKKAMDKELFFEGVLEDGIVKIYPMQISNGNHKKWRERNPLINFKEVKFTIVDPSRKNKKGKKKKKKEYSVKAEATPTAWEFSVKKILRKIKGRRFIVKISLLDKGEKWKAKLQLEK